MAAMVQPGDEKNDTVFSYRLIRSWSSLYPVPVIYVRLGLTYTGLVV
jgi:hypothetical protein